MNSSGRIFCCLITLAWIMPRETMANEFAKFLDEYVCNPVRQYQPDDPWTRSRFFRIQTGYAGLFRDCDDEEQKRFSPYICWKCSPCPTAKERFLDFISCDLDQVKQRVRDGAGECCKSGQRRVGCKCPTCARDGGSRHDRCGNLGIPAKPLGNRDCTCSICQENGRHRRQLDQQTTKSSKNRAQKQVRQQTTSPVKSHSEHPFANQFVADHAYAIDPGIVEPDQTTTQRQTVTSEPDTKGRWPNRNSIQDLLPKHLPNSPAEVAERTNDAIPPWRAKSGNRR